MTGEYADYDVVIGEDYPAECFYKENHIGTHLLRVHFRVTRVPARKLITLRHLSDATQADRATAEKLVGRLRESFARWEEIGATRRAKWEMDRRRAIHILLGGSIVNDPLVQLELEMMIDLETSVSTS